MNHETRPRRLYILWFVAAALAFTATAIAFYRLRTFDWTGAIIGGACLLMGLVSKGQADRAARGADREAGS